MQSTMLTIERSWFKSYPVFTPYRFFVWRQYVTISRIWSTTLSARACDRWQSLNIIILISYCFKSTPGRDITPSTISIQWAWMTSSRAGMGRQHTTVPLESNSKIYTVDLVRIGSFRTIDGLQPWWNLVIYFLSFAPRYFARTLKGTLALR